MNKQGYILFLTLIMLAAATAVVTQMFYIGNLYNSYIATTLERDKAKQLALSGAHIAMSQLMLQDKKLIPDDKKPSDGAKPDPEKLRAKHQKQMLKTLLLVQNRWQTFNLTHEQDGIDAQIKVCITCEAGKIDINKMYEFDKSRFIPYYPSIKPEALLKVLGEKIKPFTGKEDLVSELVAFLKTQKRPLLTTTEFLKEKKMWNFKNHIFYEPSKKVQVEDDDEHKHVPVVYLTDLLTVWGELSLDPWLLSDSVKIALGIDPRRRATQENIALMLEKVKPGREDWKTSWDTYLKPIYGREYKSLPKELLPLLSSKFEPRVFSVLCYAKVGRVGQKLLAILEKGAVKEGEVIKMKQIYWL